MGGCVVGAITGEPFVLPIGSSTFPTESFSKLTPLSSVACGDTSFLRKEAKYCGEAAATALGP